MVRSTLNFFTYIALLVAVLYVGIWAGPKARQAYETFFPEPSFVLGDYSSFYAETGTPVVIFSTSTCPHCKHARELLTREQVAFHDFVTDQSADAQKKFATLGVEGVPVLFIGKRRIVGFNEAAILEALNLVRTSAQR